MSHDQLGRRLEPAVMADDLKLTIATCYGLLWHVQTDDKRIHFARRELLRWLTKEEQAKGLEAARSVMPPLRRCDCLMCLAEGDNSPHRQWASYSVSSNLLGGE